MKVLVTGGLGFIGSKLVLRLKELGYNVFILDLKQGNDINKIDLELDVDIIFHLASYISVEESIKNPLLYHKNNTEILVRVLELARKNKVKKFVFSSSASVVECLSPYALNKKIGEDYCKLYSDIYGLNTICLRYFNVYGGNNGVVAEFKNRIKKGESLKIVNDGNQSRDYINVNDVVEATIKAGLSDVNTTLDIASGESYTVNEIADLIGGKKEYGEKRIEPFESKADIEKTKELLNWKPKVKLKEWLAYY